MQPTNKYLKIQSQYESSVDLDKKTHYYQNSLQWHRLFLIGIILLYIMIYETYKTIIYKKCNLPNQDSFDSFKFAARIGRATDENPRLILGAILEKFVRSPKTTYKSRN